MREDFNGLAAITQSALAENPFCSRVFAFRGRRGDLLKVLWFDGQGCGCWPSSSNAPASSGRRRAVVVCL